MNAAATAKVLALPIGKARQIESTDSGEWWDKPWQTGFYKEPQSGPCSCATGAVSVILAT